MKTKNFYAKHQVGRPYLHKVLSIFLLLFIYVFSAQAQEKEWDKAFGGKKEDRLTDHQQTKDGGYILGGYSFSGKGGDKSQASKGRNDYWIVKLDVAGNKQWDRTYGGSKEDFLLSLQQTNDGGYILGGYSASGISGDKSEASKGETDYWVIKIDALGNKQWDRTYGGDKGDYLISLKQTMDGGYILGGYTYSGISGDKSEASKGELDYWVIKIDAAGNKQWDRTYGGNYRDLLASLQQTTDGGYILGGYSESDISGDKSEPNRSEKDNFDYWVVKIDAVGNKQWDRTYGGEAWEILTDIRQTDDGGYIVGGSSNSGLGFDKTEENRGELGDFRDDYWVLKLDANGNKVWDRTFGGNFSDNLNALYQTSDSGYILGGSSRSGISGDKTEANRGTVDINVDYWVVKIDASGNKLWDRTYGGNLNDELISLQQTSDGGYSLAGYSNSGISGEKSEPSRGDYDYWILKLSAEDACTLPTPSIMVIPTSDVYTGGDPATIYLGYGPQSVQLVASGGTTFSWSPATGLSSTTVPDPVFTPTAPGSYTFTVTAYDGACTATATVTITVIDVRCGNGKVRLCHKGQELCIAPAAVASHLRQHAGDRLGSCHDGVGMPMALRVHPNPFSGQSQVEFSLAAADTYRLELYNAGGKMLGVVAEGRAQPGQVVSLELRGEKLREGMYYLRLITRDEVQTTRLVLKK